MGGEEKGEMEGRGRVQREAGNEGPTTVKGERRRRKEIGGRRDRRGGERICRPMSNYFLGV